MSSKRSQEGYLMIDHSASPGVPDAEGMPVRSGQGMFEAPTVTCNHCQTVVVVNPMRNRERAWCGNAITIFAISVVAYLHRQGFVTLTRIF